MVDGGFSKTGRASQAGVRLRVSPEMKHMMCTKRYDMIFVYITYIYIYINLLRDIRMQLYI